MSLYWSARFRDVVLGMTPEHRLMNAELLDDSTVPLLQALGHELRAVNVWQATSFSSTSGRYLSRLFEQTLEVSPRTTLRIIAKVGLERDDELWRALGWEITTYLAAGDACAAEADAIAQEWSSQQIREIEKQFPPPPGYPGAA